MRNQLPSLAAATAVAAAFGITACASGAGTSSPPAVQLAASSAGRPAGLSASRGSAPRPSRPATAAHLPACPISRLKITLIRRGGAVMGEVGGYLRFANAGPAACQLSGWPTVTAITADGMTVTAARAVHGTMLGAWQYAPPLPVVRLAPGAAAYAVLAAGDHNARTAGDCPAVRLLLVTAPAGSGHVTLSARLYGRAYLPACTSAGGSTEIQVSAVVPLADLAH